MSNFTNSFISENVNAIPSITIDATSKFAAVMVRLLADMTMNLSSDEFAGEKFLDLCTLSSQMEVWRTENPEKCVS